MIKKFVIFNALLVIFLTLIFGLLPISSADPSVIVYSYDLTPETLVPGDSAILRLTISNGEAASTTTRVSTSTSGSSTTTVDYNGVTIQNIWVEADMDSNGKKVKAFLNYEDVSNIAPGSSISIDIEILAEENISEGWYFPVIHIDVEDEDYQDVSHPVPIWVSPKMVDLIPSDIPKTISNNGETSITLSVVNSMYSEINSIMIQPVKNNNIDIHPSNVFVESVDADSSEDISFSVIPNQSGEINLGFNISFKNGKNLHNRTIKIPLVIIDSLDVAPILNKVPGKIKKGDIEKISIKVFNAKNEGLTGVIITPVTNYSITPSQYFIGSMDPDDEFSASFEIDSDNYILGNFTVDFVVSYKQNNNNYQSPKISASFSVVEPSNDDNTMAIAGGVIFVFVLLIVVYYFFSKHRKRKNENPLK